LSSPVLQGEAGQLGVVVDPFELQWPASLSHTGQNQPVAFQMELAAHRLRLEVGRHVICKYRAEFGIEVLLLKVPQKHQNKEHRLLNPTHIHEARGTNV